MLSSYHYHIARKRLFWQLNIFALVMRRSQEPLKEQCFEAQNSQQKSVPDLHGVTVAFLALKKNVFSEKKKNFPPIKFFFLPFFYATFQCGRYNVFKIFFLFF